MDNVSSIIDGSMAIAGVIVALVGSGCALMGFDSRTTVETTPVDDALASALKPAA